VNRPWLKDYDEARKLGLKVAVCDESGSILECSNISKHTGAELGRIVGNGWHDYLQPEELPQILAWFKAKTGPDHITYMQLSKNNGKPTMADITLVKRWVGSAWLCYGAVRFLPPGAPLD